MRETNFMNTEEIIDMARQAGFEDFDNWSRHYPQETKKWCERMETFAKLVDAKATARVRKETLEEMIYAHPATAIKQAVEYEREACAKVCEDRVPTYLKDGERWLKGKNGNPDKRLKDIAPNLEAAWEAEQLLKNDVITFITEAHLCANAIRNRGDL